MLLTLDRDSAAALAQVFPAFLIFLVLMQIAEPEPKGRSGEPRTRGERLYYGLLHVLRYLSAWAAMAGTVFSVYRMAGHVLDPTGADAVITVCLVILIVGVRIISNEAMLERRKS